MIPQTAGGMLSNPYINQLFNSQIYQQQQPLISSELHHKPLTQIMYVFEFRVTITFQLLKINYLLIFCIVVMMIQTSRNLK